MASSNKSVWLVVVLGAAAGLGFAIYYLTVLGPANEREEMTRQIEEWSTKKWRPARACLVGSEPRASAGYDAVVLRSAIPGDAAPIAGECRAFFLDLRRPGDVSSGNDQVEADWKDVEESVGMLANAYAVYEPREQDSREALGTALDRVDAAYARLREDAGLDAPTLTASKLSPIADPRSTSVSVEGAVVEADGVDVLGGGLAVHGTAAGSPVTAIVRGPGDIRARLLKADARPAAAEARWGVWTAAPDDGRAELRAGELAEDGAPAGDGVQVARAASNAHLPTPIFALGEEAERLVLYELFDDRIDDEESFDSPTPQSFWVARSRDGGATWPARAQLPITATPTIFPDSIQRRVDIAWLEPNGALQWLGFDTHGLADDPTVRLVFPGSTDSDAPPASDGDYPVPRQCVAQNAAWWLALGAREGARVAHARTDAAGPAKTIARDADIATILACDESRLLGSTQHGDEVALVLCTQTRCEPAFSIPLAGNAQFAATLRAATGPVAATLTNDLLAIWPNGDPGDAQRVFRVADVDLSGGDYLRALIEWDGQLYAVVAAAGQVRLLALPLD